MILLETLTIAHVGCLAVSLSPCSDQRASAAPQKIIALRLGATRPAIINNTSSIQIRSLTSLSS